MGSEGFYGVMGVPCGVLRVLMGFWGCLWGLLFPMGSEGSYGVLGVLRVLMGS